MSLRILRASAIVTILSLVGMGANFLLQVFLATQFGAGQATDAYIAAATIPTLMNTVFLTAMNITFIPVFIEYENKASDEEAWQVVNSFIVIVLIVLTVVALVGSFFSENLILLIAPGLGRNQATLSLAAELQRIQLPTMIFMAWGGLLAGLFYARQSFVVATLGPVVTNGVALIVAWLLVEPVGIHGIAYGVLIGNIVQVIFLGASLRARFRVRLRFNFAHPGVRQIGLLMVPWLLGAIIYKANPVVDRLVASQFPAGAISILGYAYVLLQLTVFAGSKGASLAVFPMMSHLANTGKKNQLAAVIDDGLRLVISAVIPILVLLLFLGDKVVVVLLQRGAFSAEDAGLTTQALLGYTGAIVGLSLGNVVSYVFYALQDTKTPAIIGIIGMGLNLVLALLGRVPFGFLAPAISFSVMCLFNLLLMGIILRRRLGQLVLSGFLLFSGKIVVLGCFMAGFVWILGQFPFMTNWPDILQLVVHAGLGLGCYLLGWTLLNRTLVEQAWKRIALRASA